MNKSLSIKLTIISFFLMMIVVIAHGKNIEFDANGNNTVWAIQSFILDYLSNIVIPTFFFISGYLFFLSINIDDLFTWPPFKEKIIKRFTTLGIPYFFWAGIFFLILLTIQNLPGMQAFFKTPLSSMSFGTQIFNAFWEPVNYPLWYIRELMLVVIISPLLFVLIKYLNIYLLIFLFVASLFSPGIITISGVTIFKFFMLMSFCFGAYMALHKKSLATSLSTIPQFLLIFVWIALIIVLMYIMKEYTIPRWQFKLYANISAITGCMAIWTLYDYIDKRYKFKEYAFYNYSFFIYVTHGIPILLLKSFLVGMIVPTKTEALLLYFATFLFMVIGCILCGMFLRKFVPKIYNFSMGSRS